MPSKNDNMLSDLAIDIQQLSKTYLVRERSSDTLREYALNLLRPKGKIKKVRALDNLTISIQKGEIFGIVGHNGSGKSTLLNIILGSIKADKGSIIKTQGKIMRLALGMGFDPNLTGRDNIYINSSILGIRIRDIKKSFEAIVNFSGLHEFIDTPVKFYSKGMKSRLTFAIAMHADADIFLLDEFFGGVGDANFKEKSKKIFEKKIQEGKTIVIVSHSAGVIKKYCNRAAWIEKGNIILVDKPKKVIAQYHLKEKNKE